jgi:hypothetical protein
LPTETRIWWAMPTGTEIFSEITSDSYIRFA